MSEHQKLFHFFVDAKRFETDKPSLMGAEIKAIAGTNPSYQLFLEEEGDTPDKPVADDEPVKIKEGEKHTRHFFAVPPATFGSR